MAHTPPALVPLRRAAELVVTSLKKLDRNRLRGPEYILALSEAALELSFHVPIFRRDAARKLYPVTTDQLRGGTFEDGGNILRLHSGMPCRNLLVRRDDVMRALDSLAFTNRETSPSEQA